MQRFCKNSEIWSFSDIRCIISSNTVFFPCRTHKSFRLDWGLREVSQDCRDAGQRPFPPQDLHKISASSREIHMARGDRITTEQLQHGQNLGFCCINFSFDQSLKQLCYIVTNSWFDSVDSDEVTTAGKMWGAAGWCWFYCLEQQSLKLCIGDAILPPKHLRVCFSISSFALPIARPKLNCLFSGLGYSVIPWAPVPAPDRLLAACINGSVY